MIGDDPVVERAPIVDLWIKEARRRGAEIVVCSPTGSEKTAPGSGAEVCRQLAAGRSGLAKRLRDAERAVLVWSGPGGGGGARIAELAHELGFAEKPGCGAFHLPAAANPRGVALGWAVAADADETNPEPIELLVVSGDEAASNADVRALAEQANRVLVLTMFHELAGGWADLILPSTAALERDGTSMNLEGRVQRLRRAVPPPCPDELAWISKLGRPLRRRRAAACAGRLRGAGGARLPRPLAERPRRARAACRTARVRRPRAGDHARPGRGRRRPA